MDKAISLIYASYRDDAKLTAEFLKTIRTALQDCNLDELDALCSPLTGVATLHSFPPGLFEIASFRKARREKYLKDSDFFDRYPVRQLRPFQRDTTPFRPYPKLWEAFALEAEIIDRLDNRAPYPFMSFEALTRASLLLATRGVDAARAYIVTRETHRQITPTTVLADDTQRRIDKGEWSSDDLKTPAAPLRSKELRGIADQLKRSEGL